MQDVHNDPVNRPSHYTSGGIECIDAIRASMTPKEFRGFLKADWYLKRLMEELEGA